MNGSNPEGSPDRVILLGLRSRDRSALEKLAILHGDGLARAAYLYLGDFHRAADVAQDALIAAWDAARRTGDSTALRPWLFGILFNLARKSLRAAGRRLRLEREAARRASALRPDPVEAGREGERLAGLAEALSRLRSPFREVVILRFKEAMSVKETAEALGIPEGTVKSRTSAALGELRKELEEWMRVQ